MKATKLVKGLSRLPYSTRLQKLGLYSLYLWLEHGDLIETYKILKGYYNIEWSQLFTLNPSTTRGRSLKLFKKQSRTSTFSLNTPALHDQWKFSNIVCKCCQDDAIRHSVSVSSGYHSNPWCWINWVKRSRTPIPPFSHAGHNISDDAEKANVCNQ